MMVFIYLFGVVIIIILAHSLYKGQRADIKQIPINSDREADIIDIKPSIDTPPETPKSLGLNSFLYTDDSFGKMEKGRES